MKTLIVYYSLNGNCDYVARRLAEQISADLEALHPEEEPPKSGGMMYAKGGWSALTHRTPKLAALSHDLLAYDTVIIGAPVWAGTYPPAVGSFLKQAVFKAPHLYLFACSSSGNSEKMLKQLGKKVGTVSASASFKDPLTNQDQENAAIDAFAQTILKDGSIKL